MKDSVLWRHPYQAESYGQVFGSSSVDTDGFELVEDDSQNALFYEWYRAILREPVMDSLLDLAESEGPWVGTETGLFEKVRGLTPAKAQKSGPFPSTPEQLLGHVDDVREHSWAFSAAGLVVLDRRKLTGEEAGAFDVPGWGPDHPLLVATEDAASERPLFYEALLGLARYEKPLLVAALRSTRSRPHWSGTTLQMQRRLWAHYPDNRAEEYGWIFRAAEWADQFEGCGVDERLLEDAAYTSPYSGPHDPFRLLDHSLDEWIGSKDDLSEHPKDLDLLELYRLMARPSSILKEFGVKVTYEKPSRRESTRWTIEAPRWDTGDISKNMARFWYVSRAHEAAPRALVGPGFTTLVFMPQ